MGHQGEVAPLTVNNTHQSLIIQIYANNDWELRMNATDFNTTVKFIEKLPISYLHVFPYSKRPNTKAALFEKQIDEKTRKNRVKELLEMSKHKKLSYMKRSLGAILDVIVENKNKTGDFYSAISDNYLRVQVKSSSLTSRQNLRVKVISLTDSELIAQPLK